MGVDLGSMPTIHPWMVAPHAPVHEAAAKFTNMSAQVDAAGELLQKQLGEAGGLLGWRSAGAQAAREPLVQAHTEVGMLRDVAARAGMALHSFGVSLSEYGAELRKLRTRRAELEGEAALIHDEAGGKTPEIEALIEDARQVDKQIRHFVDMLARADRSARDEMNRVADEFTTLGAVDREDEWVGDMAPPEIYELLGRYGVTESAAERGLLDKVMLLPDGPAGDEELRKLLATMTPDEVADFLLRHPDVARRLLSPSPLGPSKDYPPGSPEYRLAAALEAGKRLPRKEAIAEIQAAFAAMSPDERRRMAVLYPGLVGNLDGVPLDVRVGANRVKIGVALDDERGKQVDVTRGMAQRTPLEKQVGEWNNSDAWVTFVDVEGDADSLARRNSKRLDYYQELLYGDVEQPSPFKDGPNDQHQILYFDAAGDGKIAEMWGDVRYVDHARNVAVYVPGTMTDMELFGTESEKMRALAGKDPSGQTIGITWMGTDMPDTVAIATQSKYAEEGGRKFRDFVWGLDMPNSKRVTAIGHSYGGAIVGVADREGLQVDAVVHVASAGTGTGVRSADDYPDGADGKERYSMTAPGDLIQGSQGITIGERAGLGHGSDPDHTPGFTHLETGRYESGPNSGEMIDGAVHGRVSAHMDVTEPGTTAFENIYGVVTGGEVIPETNPDGKDPDPYEDPNFAGPKQDIPDDAGRHWYR